MSQSRRRQQGLVLYALLLGLLGASIYLTQAREPVRLARLKSERQQQAALALAREALISRAVNDANRPGSLPCPSKLKVSATATAPTSDGRAELLAGSHCPSLIGRLPWSTLDIPQPTDDNLNTLWYVMAPGLRDHQSANPINSDTPTGLSLNGVGEIAALLIQPGTPLPGQKRPSNEFEDYLEGRLSTGQPADFTTTARAGNDIILSITRAQLMAAVERRVIQQLHRCLQAHARQRGRHPWPAPLADFRRQGRSGSRFGRVPLTQPEHLPTLIMELSEIAGDKQRPLQETLTWATNLAAVIRSAGIRIGELGQQGTNQLTRAAGNPVHLPAALATIEQLGEALAELGVDSVRAGGNAADAAHNLTRDALLSNASLLHLALSGVSGEGNEVQALIARLRNSSNQIVEHAGNLLAEADALASSLGTVSEHAQLLDLVAGLTHARAASTAKALPTIWASAHCDFLLPANGWWQSGQWADSIFYQTAAPLPAELAGLNTGSGPHRSLAVIASGAAIGSQQRTSQNVADYLEGRNADPSRNGHAEAPSPDFEPVHWRSNHNDQIAY